MLTDLQENALPLFVQSWNMDIICSLLQLVARSQQTILTGTLASHYDFFNK
jgi:hypothetical protein